MKLLNFIFVILLFVTTNAFSLDSTNIRDKNGKQGIWKKYNRSAKILSEGEYKNNKKIGHWKMYKYNKHYLTINDCEFGTGKKIITNRQVTYFDNKGGCITLYKRVNGKLKVTQCIDLVR